MKMIVTTRKHSYLIDEEDLMLVELGSTIFDTEAEKMYVVFEPGVLTEINVKAIPAATLEELVEALAAGGFINVIENEKKNLELV